MYLLDTNIIAELRRPEQAHPSVVAWATSVDPVDMYLSAISILEVELGALLVARRDAAHGAALRQWIDDCVIQAFEDRILPVDTIVARRCASLHVPKTRPERDCLIAATAMAHRLTVVTRNVKDFEVMGVSIINPWGG